VGCEAREKLARLESRREDRRSLGQPDERKGDDGTVGDAGMDALVPLALRDEHGDCCVVEIDGPQGALILWPLAPDTVPFGLLQGPLDPERPLLKVDIGSAQPQQLVATRAGRGGQRDDGIEDRSLEAIYERRELRLVEAFADVVGVDLGPLRDGGLRAQFLTEVVHRIDGDQAGTVGGPE